MRPPARTTLPAGLAAAVALIAAPGRRPRDAARRRRDGAARARAARRRAAAGRPARSRRCTATGARPSCAPAAPTCDRRGAPRATDHMRHRERREGVQRRGRAAARPAGPARPRRHDRPAGSPACPPPGPASRCASCCNHTSGVPDYTRVEGFVTSCRKRPRGFVAPAEIIDWVRGDGSCSRPGSRYEYSNTDNIVVGLIAEAVTGEAYGDLLDEIVFGPAGLRETSFPTGVALPRPFIHGYVAARARSPGRHDVPEPERRLGVRRDRLHARATSAVHPRLPRHGGSSAPRSSASSCSSCAGRPARPGRARTRPGSRSSATGRAAEPSSATRATSPATCSGPPRRADGKRSVTTSLNIPAPRARCSAAAGGAGARRSARCWPLAPRVSTRAEAAAAAAVRCGG